MSVEAIRRLITKANEWREVDPDPDTRAELAELIAACENDPEADAAATLRDMFSGTLQFGTAGLRGELGPGPNRMNRVVVGRAAAGIGSWLTARGKRGGTIIVGYDARFKSHDFAVETARLLRGAGFEVLLTEGHTATPIVAFGIKEYGCVAGIVVTASHNPPRDNGYKVYLGDGSQIVAPVDKEISEHIAKVSPRDLVTMTRDDDYDVLDSELLDAYVEHNVSLVPKGAPRELTWVHTAMHGVGSAPLRALVAAAGFPAAHEVASQAEPDPNFPTVAFPNPEEAGAIDQALDLANQVNADVVIANDPDADRCAVAAVVAGQWRMLTGDELGAILGHDAIARGGSGVLANSVVSSTLLSRMAHVAKREHVTTLTGFKWIGRVPGLAFGYEEAIGYCVDPKKVPDKDGLSAALAVLRIVAQLKSEGKTLSDQLDAIMARYGLHATDQLAVRVSDLSIISAAMAKIRATPPKRLLGESVVISDLSDDQRSDLPPTDAVEFTGQHVHVVVRPSGTEPKLKCYLEVRMRPSKDLAADRKLASEQLQQLRDEMSEALGLT